MQFPGSLFEPLKFSEDKTRDRKRPIKGHIKGTIKGHITKKSYNQSMTPPALAARGDIKALKAIKGKLRDDTIMYAQHPQVLQYLLDDGIDPRYAQSISLVIAAKMGSLESVSKLIDAGADPTHQNGRSLIVSAEMGHDDVLSFLLSTNKYDEKTLKEALRLAEKYNHHICVNYIKNPLT